MPTKEIPILNASDVCEGATLMRMWAGQCAPTEVYVWGSSYENAFEYLVEHLDEHAPGCLVSHAEFQELLDEAAQNQGYEDFHNAEGIADEAGLASIIEAAETDLTVIGHTSLKNGSHIASYEWGGGEVTDSAEYREAFCRSLAECVESDVEAIMSQLQDVREDCDVSACEHDEDVCYCSIDVRLQLTARNSVSWELHSGDSSYDTDHRGYWGSSSVSADTSDESLMELARELIAQCLDHAAQSL